MPTIARKLELYSFLLALGTNDYNRLGKYLATVVLESYDNLSIKTTRKYYLRITSNKIDIRLTIDKNKSIVYDATLSTHNNIISASMEIEKIYELNKHDDILVSPLIPSVLTLLN